MISTRYLLLWCPVLLSVNLYLGAFLYVPSCGFLGLLFWLPLVLPLFSGMVYSYRELVLVSSTAAAYMYGVHFLWLGHVLLNHSLLSWWVMVFVYAAVVGYFTFLTLLFVLIMLSLYNLVPHLGRHYILRGMRAITLILSLSVYFFLMAFVPLPFCHTIVGYPLVNPLVPFARWYMSSTAKSVSTTHHHGITLIRGGKRIGLLWLFGESKKKNSLAMTESTMSTCNAFVYKLLQNIPLADYTPNHDLIIIFAPESCFPYALNLHPEIPAYWQTALITKDACPIHVLIGATYQEDIKQYQALYWLSQGCIRRVYKKRYLVDFVETCGTDATPSWKQALFLGDRRPYSQGPSSQKPFTFTNHWYLMPVMCSELLFINQRCKHDNEASSLIGLFVNDTWFPSYLRELLVGYAVLQAYYYKKDLVYCSYYKYLYMQAKTA